MKEIIGEYVKQQWTGRKQDHAEEILDNGLSMVIPGDTLVRKLLIVLRCSS